MYLSFWVWLISLSIISSESIQVATYYRIFDNMCGLPLPFLGMKKPRNGRGEVIWPRSYRSSVEEAGTSTRWLVRCYVPRRVQEHLGPIRVCFSHMTRGPEADSGWCWFTDQGPVTLWLFPQGSHRMVATGKHLCAGEGKDSEATWPKLYLSELHHVATFLCKGGQEA